MIPAASTASRPRSALPGLSPVTPPPGHSRSHSLGSGSLGRMEAQRLQAQTELGRYMEDDNEDYEDMFAGSTEHGVYRSTSLMSKL